MTIQNDPIVYGTTIFVGSMPVTLTYGKFMSYTYQNLINKSYIIALVSGKVDGDTPIYCRVHSSCVTSETLGALDCDCCPQMEGALKIISEKGGIFFYLLQEGRGCGYVGKSRACMLVQSSGDKLDTFEAYRQLGMKKDYRKYSNLKDILYMLKLNPKFILLSNNPDKVEGFRNAGLQIESVQQIEITPNPFNLHYLKSKKKSGHCLHQTQHQSKLTGLPNKCISPFNPYNLDQMSRFIHVSSYYLPVGPICGKMKLRDNIKVKPFTSKSVSISDIVMVQSDASGDFESLEAFWFKVSVYYDLVNQNEFVVLEYDNQDTSDTERECCIRIHSESIFNRFPLSERNNRLIYQRSLERIITHGFGKLVLFYHDGRGFGLGNFVLNKSITQRSGSECPGNNRDGRDYEAVALLLQHIIPSDTNINLCFSCGNSMELAKNALTKVNLSPRKLYYVGTGQDLLGHKSLQERQLQCYKHLCPHQLFDTPQPGLVVQDNCVVTGIGSSLSHAKFFHHLSQDTATKVTFKSIPELLTCSNKDCINQIILFSQGLSCHAKSIIEKFGADKISLISGIPASDTRLDKLQHHVPLGCDEERQTLLRLEGPFLGFVAVLNLLCNSTPNQIEMKPSDMKRFQTISIMGPPSLSNPNEEFTQTLLRSHQVCIICPRPTLEYVDNIRMKFVEGCGISNCIVVDPLEMAHGLYQSIVYQNSIGNTFPIIYLDVLDESQPIVNLQKSLPDNPLWVISSKVSYPFQILELELTINNYLLQLMERTDFNQKEWLGKNTQTPMYQYSYS